MFYDKKSDNQYRLPISNNVFLNNLNNNIEISNITTSNISNNNSYDELSYFIDNNIPLLDKYCLIIDNEIHYDNTNYKKKKINEKNKKRNCSSYFFSIIRFF